MPEWDQDFVDEMVPGHFSFHKDDTGEFQFGCVYGFLDCRTEEHGKKERRDFTWDGNNEMDSAMGRGWAAVDGDALEGHIYFHLGDDSGFKVTRM